MEWELIKLGPENGRDVYDLPALHLDRSIDRPQRPNVVGSAVSQKMPGGRGNTGNNV